MQARNSQGSAASHIPRPACSASRSTPFVQGALGTAFVEAARAAGFRGKSAHGLPKAAATRAAENGATEREREAIFGWSGGRMATLYTRVLTAAGLRREPSAS